MVARIRLEPDVVEAELPAGGTAAIKVVVTNGGNIVDAFDLVARELDPAWYTLSPASVSLFPQAQSTVLLRLHPPAGFQTPAGTYPFALVATSRDQPGDSSEVTITLRVAAVGELTAGIDPQRVAGRQGTYRLALINAGNTPREVVLRPMDPEERLTFSFGAARSQPYAEPAPQLGAAGLGAMPATSPDANTVQYDVAGAARAQTTTGLLPSTIETDWRAPGGEAGQGYLSLTMPPASRVELPLTVAARRRIWRGGTAVQLPFEVAATPPGVEWEAAEAKRVQAELVYRPVFAAWAGLPLALRRAVAVLIPIILLALALFALLRNNGAPAQPTVNAGATQTALALLTVQANAAGTQTALAQAAAAAAASNAGTQTALAGSSASQTQTALAQANGGGGAGGTGTSTGTGGPSNSASGPPQILRYDLSQVNGAWQLNWEVTHAITVTLNDVKVLPLGTQTVDANTDQSYTLTATNGRDIVSQSQGVQVLQPPQIQSFTADQTEVCLGCSVTLSWKVARAETITINDQTENDAQGSATFQPTANTDYLITAQSALGKDVKTLTVNVRTDITPTATP